MSDDSRIAKLTIGLSGLLRRFTDYVRSNDYRTDEFPTGQFWVDGKPIYRKVIDFGALPNAATKSIAHNISNIDLIFHFYAMASPSAGIFTLHIPHVSETDLLLQIRMAVSLTHVIIVTANDWSAYARCFAVIEYTKK